MPNRLGQASCVTVMTVGPEGEREKKEKGGTETIRRRASVFLHVHICIKTYIYNTDMISCMYWKKIHTDMHKHMHTIQTSAYPICTVHMTYARCYIGLHALVCACITCSYALYPMHMCPYIVQREFQIRKFAFCLNIYSVHRKRGALHNRTLEYRF
jgi:hypothetical protein